MTIVAGVLLTANLEAADRWLHLRVADEDGTRVSINLPFSVVEKAVPLIPPRAFRRARIECNGERIDSAAFRHAVRQSAITGTAAYDADGHHVAITRTGGIVSIVATDDGDGDVVRLRLPATVIDPMVGRSDAEIDLPAAVAAMAQQGAGDLMFADGDNATMRVWIDEKP